MRLSATSSATQRALVDEARAVDPGPADDTVSTVAKTRGRVTSVIRRTSAAPRLTPVPDLVASGAEPPSRSDREPDPPSSGTVASSVPPPLVTVLPPSVSPSVPPEAGLHAPVEIAAPPSAKPAPLTLPAPEQAVPPPPPISFTGPPSVPELSPIPSPAKPMLASEALMEDLAPVEPARRDARAWCAACGVAFLFFGLLPVLGLLPGGLGAAVPWLVTGAISLVASVAQVNYRQRAVAMLVVGMLTGVVALEASGGAALHADGGPAWGLARLFAAVSLAAALQFRARYRAYAGARVFLGTALVISVPFVVHVGLHLTREGGFGPAHLGAILVLLAVTASLTGFMGSETTGAGTYMGPTIVAAFALDLALSGIATLGIGGGAPVLLALGVGAVGFGAAAGFTSLGLFQILAWRFAADARRIDLHSPKPESQRTPDHDPPSDWSTRD